ncbi:MAG: hypothetical protein IH934_05680 [Nanoarchaeota archaeon]|nr:hypothetical protein [Nanoarchaeota archaeon]
MEQFRRIKELYSSFKRQYSNQRGITRLEVAIGGIVIVVVGSLFAYPFMGPRFGLYSSNQETSKGLETRPYLPIDSSDGKSLHSLVVPYNIEECRSLQEEHPDNYEDIMAENLNGLQQELRGVSTKMYMGDNTIPWKDSELGHPAPSGERHLVRIIGSSEVARDTFEDSVAVVVQELCNPGRSASEYDGRNGPLKLQYTPKYAPKSMAL